jgi:hypothetical protein
MHKFDSNSQSQALWLLGEAQIRGSQGNELVIWIQGAHVVALAQQKKADLEFGS